jgi:hypothetical protein
LLASDLPIGESSTPTDMQCRLIPSLNRRRNLPRWTSIVTFILGGGKYGGNFQPRETPLAHLPKSLLTKQKLLESSITSQKPLLWNPFQPNRNDRI